LIAQTGLRPLASFPSLTRIAEVAPGFDASFWMGLSVRKGASPAQLDKLHAVVQETLHKDMQDLIKRAGFTQASGSRADFGSFMAKEQEKWTQVTNLNQITTS
jgi:tripartite-type tricarboxylate transporter receptor subunit TctC